MTHPTLPLESVERDLREITETLAHELPASGTVAPDWSDTQWRLARAVAAMQGVSALLAKSLRWQDAPDGWTTFLEEQRQHVGKRYARVAQLLARADRQFRDQGIPFVALKGAALHALGIYAPGERPMADLDLLVREADKEAAERALGTLGFQLVLTTWRHGLFEAGEHAAPAALGEHSGNHLKFELHCRICERLPIEVADITASVFPPSPVPGLNRYSNPAALMSHLLLHAAGAMTFRALRLLHLHDIARLAGHLSIRDWEACLGRESAQDPERWWLYPPLHLCARYFNGIPGEVLTEAAALCPRSLRRTFLHRSLSDVSLSSLWIAAFPGIEWARSVGDRVRYAARRIAPERELLAARETLLAFESWNATADWAKLSQARRIVRWVTSRPARVETMAAVQAALAPPSQPSQRA